MYNEEVNYFMDMISEIIRMDYNLENSLKELLKAGRFYVSTHLLRKLIQMGQPEFKAFMEYWEDLRGKKFEL